MCAAHREDYDRLSRFVSDKKLRVKNTGKISDRVLSYKDNASSDSDHDPYLERMKAEGEDRDTEDGRGMCVGQVLHQHTHHMHVHWRCLSLYFYVDSLAHTAHVEGMDDSSLSHTHTHTTPTHDTCT